MVEQKLGNRNRNLKAHILNHRQEARRTKFGASKKKEEEKKKAYITQNTSNNGCKA